MSLPLREPFFLAGYRSVLIRAVLMSAVIGALSLVTGWLVILAAYMTAWFELSSVWVATGIWALVATLCIYGPLNYWNARSWLVIAMCFPALMVMPGVNGWLVEAAQRSNAVDPFFASTVLSSILSGLLLVRRSRLHVAAYVMSVCLSPVSSAMFLAVQQVSDGEQIIPLEYLYPLLITFQTAFSIACMAIPWGLPFWWPPSSRYLLEGSQAFRGAEATSAV